MCYFFFLGPPFGPLFLGIVPFLLSFKRGWDWFTTGGLKNDDVVTGYCVNENWFVSMESKLWFVEFESENNSDSSLIAIWRSSFDWDIFDWDIFDWDVFGWDVFYLVEMYLVEMYLVEMYLAEVNLVNHYLSHLQKLYHRLKLKRNDVADILKLV